jgi:hypothetical protein
MRTTARCLFSAAAGSIATFLALCPTHVPLKLTSSAYAQQAKAPDAKTAGEPLHASGNVQVDEDNVAAHYANFARVTATPEEVIVDFALNPQPFAVERQVVRVSERLVLNFYTAKRLSIALLRTIERHESTFGPIELDVRKRAVGKQ